MEDIQRFIAETKQINATTQAELRALTARIQLLESYIVICKGGKVDSNQTVMVGERPTSCFPSRSIQDGK